MNLIRIKWRDSRFAGEIAFVVLILELTVDQETEENISVAYHYDKAA